MKEQNIDIEFLISAFAYPFSLMNESFYLRKRDLKVIGVHIFDYELVDESNSEYDSGLTQREERDIKEAIIAKEKNYDSHIDIPRLTIEERFEIMTDFIESTSEFKEELRNNKKTLIESTENYGIEFYKKGIKKGIEMEYLTKGIEDKDFNSKWSEFYRNRIKTIALEWLENKKSSLHR
ncbi:hypothetical protein KFE94_13900 [bacterium SCSIO 12643]|nr:hypothetical protein KFE94_13900 [bacterium SCSIO 12643]